MTPTAVLTLANTGLTERSIWYPTILGTLVVVAGVVLFMGSIYLILGTNMGARLGFLATFAGLMGFLVVLTALWVTTKYPLNTLKGAIPKWEVVQVVDEPAEAKVEAVHSIEEKGTTTPPAEAAAVKAAVDAALVTKVDNAVEKFTPEDNKFALYDQVTEYQAVTTWELKGSKPSFLDFQFTHTPTYAVVEFCGNAPNTQPFGVAPDVPKCAAPGTEQAKNNGYVILEYNLGDVRFPPMVAFFSSVILFGISLLLLDWFEKDRRAAKQEAEAAAGDRESARERVPAGV